MQPPQLNELPYDVFFIHPDENKWRALQDSNCSPDPNDIYEQFSTPADIWVVQTCLQLRRRGLRVHLRSQLVPDSINVIVGYDLRIKSLPYKAYVVACRADGYRMFINNHMVVQNTGNAETETDHFIPHWPQPGLLKRDDARGNEIKTLAYMGDKLNLYTAFRDEKFHDSLSDLGISLVVNESASSFHDYRGSDVVIAVRDLTETDFLSKPASKLVNAWHAGVPALLGPEPAFRALRESELDYIEVSSPEEAIRALLHLRSNPELYRAMIENGFERAAKFTPDRIAEYWRNMLAGPVTDGYAKWKRQSRVWKTIARPVIFGVQAGRTALERRRYRAQRDHGFRPISGRYT